MWIYSLFKILAIIMKNMSSKLSIVDFVRLSNSRLYVQNLNNLNIVKNKSDNYKMFLSDFFSMIFAVWIDQICNLDLLNASGRLLYIVNSSNIWLCGDLNKRIFSKFKNLKNKNDIDVFCIWKKAFNFFVENWYNVIWYIKDCNDFSDLNVLFDLLNNSFVNYSEIKLLSNTKNSVSVVDLYSFNKSQLIKFVSNFWLDSDFDSVSCWITVDQNTIKEFVLQLSQYIIYGAFLLNKVEELSIRKMLLKPINRGLIMRKIVLSFNEKRQTLLTQKIMELMAVKECAVA